LRDESGGILDPGVISILWGKVLVSDKDGADRALIIAAAWMHALGCMGINAALSDIGKLRIIEPNPILLRSAKRALK
jgi:hypothetical protein